ncbi:MAG: hypothetical protein IJG41_10050 [Bacteroidales bacterium]|nr:hypothetical protein [Bacteroidales bacterium]
MKKRKRKFKAASIGPPRPTLSGTGIPSPGEPHETLLLLCYAQTQKPHRGGTSAISYAFGTPPLAVDSIGCKQPCHANVGLCDGGHLWLRFCLHCPAIR